MSKYIKIIGGTVNAKMYDKIEEQNENTKISNSGE